MSLPIYPGRLLSVLLPPVHLTRGYRPAGSEVMALVS